MKAEIAVATSDMSPMALCGRGVPGRQRHGVYKCGPGSMIRSVTVRVLLVASGVTLLVWG